MKTRLLLSTMALTFGVLVVGVSLSTATEVKSLEGSGSLTDRSMYWDRPIGPDHSFYWVLMVNDRVNLETATPEERVRIQINYAHTRLKQGRDLVSDDPQLAASTLSKGEKYLLHAVNEYFKLDSKPDQLGVKLLEALEYHHQEITTLVHDLPHELRSPLDQLRQENKALQETLAENLKES